MLMIPVIYYRPGKEVSLGEIEAMQKSFRCVTSRMKVEKGELCIARYSALPYYKDLETDLEYTGYLKSMGRGITRGMGVASYDDDARMEMERLDFMPCVNSVQAATAASFASDSVEVQPVLSISSSLGDEPVQSVPQISIPPSEVPAEVAVSVPVVKPIRQKRSSSRW